MSYDYAIVRQLKKGYKFNKVIREDNIYIYEYKKGNELIYVLWSPTENNTVVNNFKFNVGNYSNATLTKMKKGEALGVTSNVDINNKEVELTITESPLFLKVSNIKEDKKEEPEEKKEEQQEEPKEEDNKEIVENKEEINNKNIITQIVKVEPTGVSIVVITTIGLLTIIIGIIRLKKECK